MKKNGSTLKDLRSAISGATSSQERLRVFASSCVSNGIADAVAFESRNFSSICTRETSQGIEGVVFRPYESLFGIQGQLLLYKSIELQLPCFLTRRSEKEAELLDSIGCSAAAIFSLGTGWIEFQFQSKELFEDKDKFSLIQLVDYFRSTILEDLASQRRWDASPMVSQEELRSQFQQVAEYGNLLIIRTDKKFAIREIFGDTEFLFGIRNDELQSNKAWERFVHPDDLRKIALMIRRMGESPGEINEEIRLVHSLSKTARWFMLKAIPFHDENGAFAGWEGFGVDISEKRRIEEDLRVQSRRVEALYEVARAVRTSPDSAVVSLKGLLALIRATKSDCGFSCFYNAQAGKVEVTAAKGLSAEYLEKVESVVDGNSLVRHAVEQKQGLLLDNIQQDSRANAEVARIEDLRSTIVMPLECEGEVLGAIVLFCRKARRYTLADFELVSAAASQIGLAIRQANFYAAEKRQADSVAIMYRLSHELSRLLTAQEVAEHTFPIVQEVISCKRMWLGVVNEQGTHLIGQGGMGPGVRRSIKEIQIELELRHDFLDEAISTKRAVIVPAGAEMQCSGLNRLIRRLDIGNFVIIPLVSLGKVIGVFIIEPSVPAQSLIQRKLPLLSSMANEIASVMLARRFESKMANADKMRMAGLLASGVAHNFNNLLQAVMGQASLIEMQVEEGSPVAGSAQTIVDAAAKGASLIKQLLSFSMQDGLDKKEHKISKLLSESRDLYASLLGSNVHLKMEIDPGTPRIEVDYGQIQQIITNLLMNAKEAISDSPDGFVRMHARKVRVGSGEIDPELPPGDYMRLDIEDNGSGMDPERAQRCFEPFYTTKDVDANTGIGLAGSGLGLSSAYSIARAHGGILTVTSSPGEGSVFSLYLPVAENMTSKSDKNLQVHDAHKVVICGIEDSVSSSLRSMFYSLGFEAEILESGEKVQALLDETPGAADLVVFDADRYGDILESDMEDLLKKHPDIYCIVSTVESPFWADIFGEFSNVSVVEKPLGVWAIQPVVRKILNSRKEEGGFLASVNSTERESTKAEGAGGLVRMPVVVGSGGRK